MIHSYLQRAKEEFTRDIKEDYVLDAEGDDFPLHDIEDDAVRRFAVYASQTNSEEDARLEKHVLNDVKPEEEYEDLVKETIASVREYLGIV